MTAPQLQSSALSSITAIASRIQEKADILTSERNLLEELQQQVQDLTAQHKSQLSQNERLKYELLTHTRKKVGVEIELMKRVETTNVLKKQISSHKKEIECLEKEIARVKTDCARDQETFSPHMVTTELFQRKLEDGLQKKRERRRKREQKLDSFVVEREKNLELSKDMKRDQERIESEIEVMKHVEVAEDEEVAALAMQIRATLSKRTSLRRALEDARDRNREANETMVKWEKQCIRFSNQRVP